MIIYCCLKYIQRDDTTKFKFVIPEISMIYTRVGHKLSIDILLCENIVSKNSVSVQI